MSKQLLAMAEIIRCGNQLQEAAQQGKEAGLDPKWIRKVMAVAYADEVFFPKRNCAQLQSGDGKLFRASVEQLNLLDSGDTQPK